MKEYKGLIALITVTLLGQYAATASIVSQTDPAAGGIIYRWTVTLDGQDSASVRRHVGAWAWEDSSLFLPGDIPVGWTHNSDWVALSLEEDAYVTFLLTNAENVPNPTLPNPDAVAGSNLFPGMTIYSGWDNDLAPQAFADANNGGEPVDNWHSYVNRGDIDWAEDTHYVTHLEPNGTHAVEATIFMPAGDYTIAIGGKSPSTSAEPRQGYEVTLTASQVPEPNISFTALLGSLAFLRRRRPVSQVK